MNTGSQTSQTLTFDVASTTSPAYTATPPVSTSTWPTVLPPDAMTAGQAMVGLGPYYNLGMATGELQTGHSLPSYHPSIAPLQLTYNSSVANAKPVFIVHFPIDSSQAVPPTVSAQLTLNGTAGQAFYYTTNGGATNPGDIMQIALQADATSLSTGRYSYSIAVTANYTTPVTTTYSGSVDVLNYNTSPFGAGWSLAGLERITSVTGGVILDLGGGLSLWFANGQTQGTFNTPAGDFSTLALSGGTYTRTLTDGTKINFNGTSGLQTSVVDRNGNTTNYNYNGSNQLTSISDFNAQAVTLSYSAGGLVTSFKDPANRLTTLSYDASSNLTAIQDPDTAQMGYTYDSSHRATTITDPRSNTATIAYNFAGRVSAVSRPDGTSESHSALQMQGLVQNGSGTQGSPATSVLAAQAQGTYTDPRSNAWASRLDWLGFGEPAQAQDPLSDMTVSHRDANGLPWLVADPLGHRYRDFFDSNANPNTVVQPDDSKWQYTYNSFSEVLQTTDPLNHLATSSYDTNGNQTQTKDALGDLTTYTYTSKGFVSTTKDALGHVVTNAYDTLSRVTAVTDALGNVTTYALDSAGRQTTLTDARGGVTTYLYDGMNRQTQTTDAGGNISTSLFDASGNRTASIDALGHRVTYSFDQVNRQTQTKDALGNLMTTVFDGSGNVSASVDGLGNRTTYSFDSANRQTQKQDALGNLWTTVYDAAGNVQAKVDPLGNRTTYSLDALNRQTQVKDALGNLASTLYDAAANVTVSIDQLGRRTTYAYDALNRKTQTTDALGDLSTIIYDAVGNTVATIDQLGHRVTYSFDAANQQTQVKDALGNLQTTTYDADGNVWSSTDANGDTTTFSYDAKNQQTVTRDALGDLVTTAYDAVGDVTSVDTGFSPGVDGTAQNSYDADNRLTASTDALGHTVSTVFDAAGNAIKKIDALGYTTTYAFDALNRVTTVTDPAGDVSTSVFDAAGNLTNSIDPLGHKTTYIYDALNRRTQTVDARGGITTLLFDAVGNNTTVVDPVGNRTTMAFDALNRLTQQTDPLGHSGTTAFDAAGRKTDATDRNGLRRSWTYDLDNRVLTEVWKNSGGTTVNTLAFTYDNAGNQLTAVNGNGAYTMTYDQLNRVTVTKEPFGATLTSTYDAASRRTLLKDSFGGVLTSSYDKANNLMDRTYSLISGNSLDIGLGYTARNELNLLDRFSSNSLADVLTTFTYDPAGRVTFMKHYDTSPSHNTFARYTYVYDAASRLTSEKLNGTTTTYQYDATNELINDTANSYSYDLNGNRNYGSYTTGSANELTNDGVWTYSYDSEGNLTKKSKGASAETWFYGYDNVNHLTSAKQEQTDGGTLLMQATYLYDAYGNRLEKDVWTQSSGTTTTTRFAYDGQNAWADLDSGNNLLTRRVYGDVIDQLFARESSSGTVAWYLTDRLGSVRDIVDTSSNVLDHINFDGFGNVTSETSPTSGDRYKWTGREFDSELVEQYSRARFYDAKTGRWTAQDQINLNSGDPNLYRYLFNDPTLGTDSSGMRIDFKKAVAGPVLSIKKPTEDPIRGRNGAFAWGIDWQVKNLPQGSTGGVIIQKLTITWDIVEGLIYEKTDKTKPRRTPFVFTNNPTNTDQWGKFRLRRSKWYEMWKVDGNGNVTPTGTPFGNDQMKELWREFWKDAGLGDIDKVGRHNDWYVQFDPGKKVHKGQPGKEYQSAGSTNWKGEAAYFDGLTLDELNDDPNNFGFQQDNPLTLAGAAYSTTNAGVEKLMNKASKLAHNVITVWRSRKQSNKDDDTTAVQTDPPTGSPPP